jgi:hypothetical protein
MAIAPVIIELLAKGAPAVSQSFKSVADAAAKAERQVQRESERAAKARERIADNEAKAKIRAWQKADAEVRRAHQAGDREAERVSRNATRMAEREARDKVRAMAKADAEIQRIRERSSAQAARMVAKEEADRNRAAMQWVKQREKEIASERSARAKVASSMVGAGAQGVASGVKRVAGVAAGLAGTAAQLGGGFSLADSLQGEKALRQKAAQLSASTILSRAGQPGEESVGRAFGTDELVSKAKAIGIEQNLDPGKILEAVDTIKGLTGNVEKAVEVVPYVAKLATATGGDVSEMSGLAANILASNQNISNKDLQEQLRIFTRQGVVGGVEVADFAKHGSRLTAGASLFGGDKSQNQATMGAFAQISRQYGGASSASEAALAAQRFATDVASHSDSLKKQGINVTDGKGNLRDAKAIIMDMVAKTGGDVTKMKDMGLGERGVKALTGVSAIYKDKGGGQAGMDAIKAEFERYTKGVTEGEVDAANKRVLGEGGASLDQAMMKLRNTVGEQLLPEFIKLVPVIQESAPMFASLLRDSIPPLIEVIKQLASFAQAHKDTIATLAKNPVGTLVAFEIAKSFASAALPSLLQSLMKGAFGASGGAGGGSGVPGAAGGGGGLVLAGVAAQAAAGYDLYSSTKGAMDAGKAAAATASTSDIAAAREKASGANVGQAWSDRLMRGLSVMSGPMGIAATYASDAAVHGLGYKTTGDRAEETIKSAALVSETDKMAASSRDAAEAIAALAAAARGGAGAGNSGPNGAGRKDSIADR